jgi:excisionase family DNA binding protein
MKGFETAGQSQITFFENQKALTATELAASLGISERLVAEYVARGVPFIPIGRERRFLFTEVVAWLREPKKGLNHGKKS